MGYLHIDNLYKNQHILKFKECYALEKIHGTSANINYSNGTLNLFSGGESYDKFAKLFDKEALKKKIEEMKLDKIHIYGEAYGGKQQGMSSTYGKDLKFIVFDVKIGDSWLDVPDAEDVANKLGLEFVYYERVSTELEELNKQRDKESTQAIRNGVGSGKVTEGVVLRPLTEMNLKNGDRIIAKHKRDEFKETKTKREVNPEQAKLLENAMEIAEEWVTEMRLSHVLDKLPHGINMESTKLVIEAMVEDVYREAKGEIVESREVSKQIGIRTAKLFKQKLQKEIV